MADFEARDIFEITRKQQEKVIELIKGLRPLLNTYTQPTKCDIFPGSGVNEIPVANTEHSGHFRLPTGWLAQAHIVEIVMTKELTVEDNESGKTNVLDGGTLIMGRYKLRVPQPPATGMVYDDIRMRKVDVYEIQRYPYVGNDGAIIASHTHEIFTRKIGDKNWELFSGNAPMKIIQGIEDMQEQGEIDESEVQDRISTALIEYDNFLLASGKARYGCFTEADYDVVENLIPMLNVETAVELE